MEQNQETSSSEFISILYEITSKLYAGGDHSFRIKEVLGIIRNKTQARRVYLSLDEERGHFAEVVFEWTEPGLSQKNPLQKAVYAQLPSFKMLLLKDGKIVAEDAEKLPEDLKDALKPGKVRSWIALPLEVNGRHSGFIGLEDCSNKIVFEEGSSGFLGVLARIISAAFQQNNYLLELESLRKNSRSYSDAASELIIIADLNGCILYANEAVTKKLNYTPDELTRMQISGLFPEIKQAEALGLIRNSSKEKNELTVQELQEKFGGRMSVEAMSWRGLWSGKQCVFVMFRDLTRQQQDLIKFKSVFELNPNPMSLSDPETKKFLEVNEAFLKLTRYSREEIIGKTAIELGLFPDWKRQSVISEALAGGETFSGVILDVCDKNGDTVQGLFSGTTVEIAGKKLSVILMVDITEKNNLIKRIEEQNMKLQAVLEASKLGTWTWDIQTGETTIDNRIAEMLGYEMRELSPEFPSPEWETMMITDLTRFLHPEDAPLSREILQRHFRKETEYYSCEFRMKHKSGCWIWVHNRGKVTASTADGRPHIMLGTYTDITERKATAKIVEDNEKRLNALLSNLPDIVSLMDETGKIKYVSPNYERLFGWKQKDLTGRTAWELVHEDDREKIKAQFMNHAKDPDSTTITTFRLKRADGTYRFFELTTKNLLHDPAVKGMILSGHEISGKQGQEK